MVMDKYLTAPFRPSEFSTVAFGMKSLVKIKPSILRPRVVAMAMKEPVIDGLTDEMNEIAIRNLDFAPSRRLVRSVFAEVQQQLDHCLFKVSALVSVFHLFLCFFYILN